MNRPTLREWLQEAPFSLAMSSGYFGFFAHAGALASLVDAGFVPSHVSGSSAGGMVAIAYAAGVEPDSLAEQFVALKRADFWDPGVGVGLLKGKLFQARLEALLPVQTFAETRVPCAVSVFNLSTRRTDVIRSGGLAIAARATCALPGLFHPVRHQGQWLWDGGILDRPGLNAHRYHERILYVHLPSRNPQRNAPERLPRRPNMVTVPLQDVPRLGPNRLQQGESAVQQGRAIMLRALHCKIMQ